MWLFRLDQYLHSAVQGSTIAPSHPYITFMKELLRTNDITLIPLVKTLLAEEGIMSFEMDVNMSVLEGSIGILPRRLMVHTDQLEAARTLLRLSGLHIET